MKGKIALQASLVPFSGTRLYGLVLPQNLVQCLEAKNAISVPNSATGTQLDSFSTLKQKQKKLQQFKVRSKLVSGQRNRQFKHQRNLILKANEKGRICHTPNSHWLRNLGYVGFEFALQLTFGA